MNFLAHCALSVSRSGVPENPQFVVGGFLGDFVKGAVPSELPRDVQTGIRLHRRIDAFSAIQDDIKASVARLPAPARRLAPVFIDLVADHFLARHFEAVHGEPLAAFSSRIYAVLEQHESLFPVNAVRFSRFMRDRDLLGRYVDIDPIERAFRRIAERLGREEAVHESMAALRDGYREFEDDFLRYYPALQAHASDWLTAWLAADQDSSVIAAPRSRVTPDPE
ncbi:MAG TPA: ACP phosphodiesterase [Pseudomonadales bacterium]|nr:ACP phosphodiesterase [Pseudomonadales bacterium]